MAWITYTPVQYDLLKIKPDSRLTSSVYSNIIETIYSTRKPIKERVSQDKINKYNANIQIQTTQPITYEIMFDGSNKKTTPLFCFGVPQDVSQYLKQRIQGILPNSTLTFENEDYATMFKNSYMFEYNYAKDNMLSLKISDNNFLQMMLNIKNDIQIGEQILFQVEMLPIGDMWKSFNDEKWDKIREGKDVTGKGKLFDCVMREIGNTIDEFLFLADEIIGNKDGVKNNKSKKANRIDISEFKTSSKTKKGCDGFNVNIKAYVKCKSLLQAKSYAKTIETAMRELEEDNRLEMKYKKQQDVSRGLQLKSMFGIGGNLMSGKELASIVNIPNQRLQREFKIDSINVKQINAPKEMLKGKLLIGYIKIHGEVCGVYMSEDRDLTCLPLFLLTKMGAGKTTFLLNLCNDAIKAKHGLVLFDYIKNCATSEALIKMHPNCKQIRFDKLEQLCTFAFPEVPILDTDTPYDRKIKANILAKEVKYLLNSMASDTENMSRIMSEFLSSACKVVFVYKNETLYNVYRVLINAKIRNEYITKVIQDNIFTEDSFEIMKLRELDDKPQKADGILDRFSVINEDTLFQEMFMKPYDNNVNFVDIMNNSEPVLIMMPQDIFTSKIHKDVICTYFMSRIRLAMSRRTNFDQIAHIVVDEIHQIPKTMSLVSDTIAEPRKFSMQYVMSLHSMSQIDNKAIRDKIMSVGCNFMLLKGLSAQGFQEFKPLLNDEWEYDDLINMDYKYGSLNIFMVDNSYKTFISELPPALTDKNGKVYI